ncbi:U3 snoRNP protein, partial [Linderina pennispora]
MAETVQYHLEQMVPELEDLERKKIFTKVELKGIVKKRTNFEYALKKRGVGRVDFLRYIEYEINVDALRRKRKKRLGVKGRTTISDYSIEQRINGLFERALFRHSADVVLWLQYIEFVKSRVDPNKEQTGNMRLLSKLFARAIQAHPYEVRLWIMAAAYEFEVNANGSAARALLQRGLRVNPKDKRLWIEYFRLELMLVEKIKARRRMLGIDSEKKAETQGEKEKDEDDNMIVLPELDEEKGESMVQRLEEKELAKLRSSEEALTEEQQQVMSTESNPVLQGAVAKLVYAQAIVAIPQDLDFREQFAAIYLQFSDMEQARQEVFDSIARDFAHDPQARAYLSTVHLASVNIQSAEFVDALRQAVDKFKQALQDVDTAEMWEKYIVFLQQWQVASDTMKSLEQYFGALVERAFAVIIEDKSKRLTPKLALMYIDVMNGDEATRLSWLTDATLRFPDSDSLWHSRLTALIEAHRAGSGSASAQRIERLFEVETLAHNLQSRKLWDLWLDWTEERFKAGDLSSDRVQSRYLAAFVRVAQLNSESTELKAFLQIRFVNWAAKLPPTVQLRAAADINTVTIDEENSDDEDAAANTAA